MKPFHYNQDPLYAAAASILQGHLTEDAAVHPNIFVNKIYSFMQDKKKEGLDLNELISALNFKFNIRYENLDTEKQKAILKAWKDLGGPIDYRKNPHLKEDVVAFKNLGFKQLNGLMSDDEIHRAVNSTIKRESEKLGDSTWDVVTDIYGKRANGEWAGDWIMGSSGFPMRGGGRWLTIKDGGPFKAHDSISSVLSFFEMEEEVKVDEKLNNILKQNKQEWDKIKSGKLELMDSNKLYDELYTYFSSEMPYGVAKARDGDPDEWIMNKLEQMGYLDENIQEGDEGFHSQKMIKNQLNTIVRNSNICLQMIEDDREFPEWAQSEIAVAEDGIVSVTEFMESHASGDKTKIDEAGPETKYTFINAIRHAQKMGNTALVKTTTSNFKAWAVKNNAMKDPEVLEYVYDFDNMGEAKSSYGMGTATIVDPDNKSKSGLDGKQVNIFHKFDDGRINVQYKQSDRKGDVLNLTLNKGQYKLDTASLSEQTFSEDALKSILNKIETQSFKDWYDNDFTDYIQGDEDGKTREEILKDLKSLLETGYLDR